MGRACVLELFWDDQWSPVAHLELASERASRAAPTWLEYDVDHAYAHLQERGHRAVSVRFAVGYELHRLPGFPAFAIDLMPQGEARRTLEARLRNDSVRPTEWAVLTSGASNPVGNLRVAESVVAGSESTVGVSEREVATRGDAFHEWAEAEGMPMTGSTDTGGASPKLLLTADAEGLLHADGALPDARARRHFIVKFPRGRTQRDLQVLANEAPYLEVLRRLGLRCGDPLRYLDGALFVPRFDRLCADGRVERRGMESVYSLLGVVEGGARLAFEDVARGLAEVVDEPHADLIELVLRDAVALALGNTDNHGRNTSLLKHPDGRMGLSPIYDFAPMYLDPEMIHRRTLWRSEPPGGVPDWNDVAVSLESLVPRDALAPAMRELGERLESVDELMRDEGVDAEIIERRASMIRAVAAALKLAEGG